MKPPGPGSTEPSVPGPEIDELVVLGAGEQASLRRERVTSGPLLGFSSGRRTTVGWVALVLVLVVGLASLNFAGDAETTSSDTEVAGDGGEDTATPTGTEGDYWLGEEAGLYALARDRRTGLVRLDMDTGEIAVLDSDLSPLIFTGQYVVLRNRWGRLHVLEPKNLLAPLVADPPPISDEHYRDFLQPTVSSDLGKLWLADPARFGGAVEVDLESGEELRRRARGDPLEDYRWVGSTPRFHSPATGGIYEMEATGSFVKVKEGRVGPEAFGRMLISTCDEQLQCTNLWVDSGTMAPLPELHASPAMAASGTFIQGRLVRLENGILIDIETGGEVALTESEFAAIANRRTSISPDARFVGESLGVAVNIRSLTSGAAATIDVKGAPTIVFVPKPTGVGG